jgi:CheY-like chemotaxis protein
MAKIMLVEDDNNLREIYEARLLAEGYEIVSAKDGEEALALAVKEKPDLIISDVMMPKISGFDMLDILRTTPETKNTKVIMMTALSQAEDKTRADKLGADRYLVKSQVTLEDVAKVAREVLQGEDVPSEVPPEFAADVQAGAAEPAAGAAAPAPAPVVEPTAVAEPPATDPVTPPAPAGPATDPEPAPAVPPPAQDAPAASDDPATDLTQTTAAEEAAVDAQINDFLAQATEASPTPAEAPAQAAPAGDAAVVSAALQSQPVTTEAPAVTSLPTAAPVEQIAVAAPPPDATAAAADNAAKLADAVNDLLDKPAAPPAVPSEKAAAPVAASVDNDHVSVNGKKVIQPVNDLSAQGPNLNELLEE